jgi:hypothetical protein
MRRLRSQIPSRAHSASAIVVLCRRLVVVPIDIKTEAEGHYTRTLTGGTKLGTSSAESIVGDGRAQELGPARKQERAEQRSCSDGYRPNAAYCLLAEPTS